MRLSVERQIDHFVVVAAPRPLPFAIQRAEDQVFGSWRWPAKFDTSPTITWVQLWERTDRYVTYLYFDVSVYEPYPHHIEEVRDRWVVSPPDVYYFVESGAYKNVFLTFSLIWWASGIVTVGLVYLFSTSERLGARP